jgi:hypothetical protein
MRIVNLTPHPIALALPTGERITLPSEGLARATPGVSVVADEGLPVPVVRAGPLGPVTGLPGPVTGTVYIVSALVRDHPDCVGRRDVLSPATGPADGAIRGASGQIEAVTRLAGRSDV